MPTVHTCDRASCGRILSPSEFLDDVRIGTWNTYAFCSFCKKEFLAMIKEWMD